MSQAMVQNDLRNKFQVYLAEAEYLKTFTPDRKIVLLDSALSIAKQTEVLRRNFKCCRTIIISV